MSCKYYTISTRKERSKSRKNKNVYCEAVGRHGIITDMDTILVFSTSIGRAHADMLAGVRDFAKDADWNVQSFLYDGEPFPVRKHSGRIYG